MSPPQGSLRGPLLERAVQRAVVALWTVVIPALLALLVLRFLVPLGGSGLAGVVATVGRGLPVPAAVGLFLTFSAVLRYWRFWIPGGRYASLLPAQIAPNERDPERLAQWASRAALHEAFVEPATRRRLDQTLSGALRSEVDVRVAELRAALEAGDASRGQSAADSLASIAHETLAWRSRREVAATFALAGAAALTALVVRSAVAMPYKILSASMLPTLEPDDLVWGKRVRYAPGTTPLRGDILAFRTSTVALSPPVGGTVADVLVKRVIGLPGDRISMKGGQPVINGWPVPFCDAGEYVFMQPLEAGGSVHGRLRVEFLDGHAYLTVHSMSAPFTETYEVKPGEVFVLGDNRGNSLDSRAWNQGHGGGVPLAGIDAIAGRFLVGTHRNGEADFGRMGRSVDELQLRLRAEGMNTQSVLDGVARCLEKAPVDTRAPSPNEIPGARASLDASP